MWAEIDCDSCETIRDLESDIEELEDKVEMLTKLLADNVSYEQYSYLKCKYNL